MHELGRAVMRMSGNLLLPYVNDSACGHSAPMRSIPVRPFVAGGLLAAAMALSGCSGVAQAGPQPGVAPGYGTACYAGFYMCRLPQQAPTGSQCSCPGIGAPSYGTVR